MDLSKDDLIWAAAEGVISTQQADLLWRKLLQRKPADAKTKFDLANVAYYFGALIVMSAMGWLMTLGWEQFGGLGIVLLSILYALLFALAGATLWMKDNLKTPGGLLITLAVWMTPLAIYGLEKMSGMWEMNAPSDFHSYHVWINGSWIIMEIGTIMVGLIALYFVRFPFLTFPVAFSLWYMSMDLTPLLLHRVEFSWQERLNVSLWFGLVMLVLTYLVDRRTRQDFAFWGYLFGLVAFWGGMSLMESDSPWRKFAYCMINVALILLAVFLQRRAFLVFGACGVFGYLSYLSYDVFKDSFLFPMALTLLGLIVIFLGVQYQRHRTQFEDAVLAFIPESIRRLRPAER
jgi:hypothetical protein